MATDEDYLISRDEHNQEHIVFDLPIRFNLHNVGKNFSLADAVAWVKEAIDSGLRNKDFRDNFIIEADTAELIERPPCKCYEK